MIHIFHKWCKKVEYPSGIITYECVKCGKKKLKKELTNAEIGLAFQKAEEDTLKGMTKEEIEEFRRQYSEL